MAGIIATIQALLEKPISWEAAATITAVSTGALLLRRFWNLRPTSRNGSAIALRLLIEECQFMIRMYRMLDQDFREESRLPLHSASWPEFGKIWTYPQYCMSSLSSSLKLFLNKAELVWKESGWTDSHPIFQTGRIESTLLANLIGDLDSFQRALEHKIRQGSQQGRKLV